MEIKIRPLCNSDFFAVVDMLMKLGNDAGREVTNLISSKKTDKKQKKDEEKQNNKQEKTEEEQERERENQERETIFLGFTVIQTCYKHVQGDLIKWFASLCEKTKEEYLALPPETTLQIMEYLAEAQEAKSFFTRAWQLFSKMKSSANRFTARSN